jgi:transposase
MIINTTRSSGCPDSEQGMLYETHCGDLIKLLWWDGQGLCLFAKRLEKGRFVWPMAATGTVSMTAAQLAMLLEGIDWRAPLRSWRPELAG